MQVAESGTVRGQIAVKSIGELLEPDGDPISIAHHFPGIADGQALGGGLGNWSRKDENKYEGNCATRKPHSHLLLLKMRAACQPGLHSTGGACELPITLLGFTPNQRPFDRPQA